MPTWAEPVFPTGRAICRSILRIMNNRPPKPSPRIDRRLTLVRRINSYPVDPPDISGSIQNPTGGSARYPLGPKVAAESCARPSGAGATARDDLAAQGWRQGWAPQGRRFSRRLS
ncbi:hypothetical protein PCANC_04580 [Puccinia coronata f. sp. avenae]|uniref:Uncharacterized protein n=1 Tax=Puccinia coronata f. sp. avenae TaxID=200324 RepID=A0A2N5VQI8_9BASI|nr:hypothetical protein PCANC_21540 [Puccinia coronata f. sp. avenae]PLW52273.1 hypothetical protein PCASD_00034 [Puccinia coronata f. sp. avenae]PLW55676.1 hypothetical protein PCANC_04580 [Puccinia coronata f. sp. avenae]